MNVQQIFLFLLFALKKLKFPLAFRCIKYVDHTTIRYCKKKKKINIETNKQKQPVSQPTSSHWPLSLEPHCVIAIIYYTYIRCEETRKTRTKNITKKERTNIKELKIQEIVMIIIIIPEKILWIIHKNVKKKMNNSLTYKYT